MMKRSRDEGDEGVVIDKFRELLIEKGFAIAESERSKIPDRSLDSAAVEEYVKRQKSVDEFDGKILEMLLGSVDHVTSAKMFSDMEEMSTQVSEKLLEYEDRRFYVVLGGTDKTEDGCYYGSSMFVATMMMALQPDLASDFVDFVCDSSPIHTPMDDTVPHFLYADGTLFSGEEVVKIVNDTRDITRIPDPSVDNEAYHHIHIIILYVAPKTIVQIIDGIRSDTGKPPLVDTHWYTTTTHPRPIKKSLHGLLSDNSSTDLDRVLYRSNQILQSEYGHYTIALEKPLFYTDVDMSDSLSTYPLFLLSPIVVTGEDTASRFPKSIVKNCPLVLTEDQEKSAELGDFCPRPLYKQEEWKSFVNSNVDKKSLKFHRSL